MGARFEAFGLTELVARPEDAFRLCNLAIAEGRRIRGYRGDYYRMFLGDAVVVVRTVLDENDEPQILGMDTHGASGTMWDCTVLKDVTPEDADPMSRRLLVGSGDPSEMAVLDVLSADVHPRYEEGSHVQLGVAAFPLRIDYSEEPCDSVISAQIDTVLLQGTVKDLRVGKSYMGMEPMTQFVIATVSTPLGDVELYHTGEIVREEQKPLVRVGATVSAYCALSGDAGVGEYESGVVFSEENDLAILRDCLIEGGTDRLGCVLRSDCTVRFLEREAQGLQEAAVLLEEIDAAMEGQPNRRVDYGVITASEDKAIPTGKRCLLVGDGNGVGYAMLAYVLTDSLGRVRELVVTRDPNLDFEPEC